jgi:hypothetical protein
VPPQPLLRAGCPAHLLLLALRPVWAPRWVIGGMAPGALRDAGERGGSGLHQCRLACPTCPRTVVPNLAGFHPFSALVRVAAFRPPPAPRPVGMSHLLQDVCGGTVPVILRPAPYDRVKFLDSMPCRGVLMGVQGGAECPHGFENFFLRWDGQPLTLFPACPDVKPQEVHPFCDVHDPGFGFLECQATCVEQLCHPWSRIGCQYFPGRGRAHTVIGGAYDRYAFVASLAGGRGFGWSIWPCGLPQPFHAIPCPLGQEWGKDAALGRAGVRGRDAAACDDSGVPPAAPRGGADRPFGQHGARVNVVKRPNILLPLSTTHRSTT